MPPAAIPDLLPTCHHDGTEPQNGALKSGIVDCKTPGSKLVDIPAEFPGLHTTTTNKAKKPLIAAMDRELEKTPARVEFLSTHCRQHGGGGASEYLIYSGVIGSEFLPHLD